MGHRTVKRVPMDFDAPHTEVFAGYVMPEDVCLAECETCEGTGMSPTARWLHDTFYDHHVVSQRGWGSFLVQDDVDVLVAESRLSDVVDREPTADNQRNWERVIVPRTAEWVNAQRHIHDGINVWILVKHRCDRLGAVAECPVCEGDGNVGTPEERERYDNWVGTEPPEGDGWQLWETTSEGSPQSPVFATARELADWCGPNATVFADIKRSADDWLASFEAETTDVDTLMMVRVPS